ncbi:MAG: DNA adenine methylase [Hyalangium sp.]|uniref:DNA adenine methylase n=1 Tax=Hyalangium sp. TaxID=2028555 RepID=UPI003899CAED
MTVRYIGSKSRLVSALAPFIGSPKPSDGVFVEPFCGTGVVAEEAARMGWRVRLNDHLKSATIMAAARLTSKSQARFASLGGYRQVLEHLNALPPTSGFTWREYSPASLREVGIQRMYFTEENAARIDAIRQQVAQWAAERAVSATEERLLLADLLAATNRVANIVGTYGCFLSHWLPQAREPLQLAMRDLFPHRVHSEILIGDVHAVPVAPEDLVYLDPPYTKRQYAAYYHILETIAVGDTPAVEGITGLRPWRDRASDFCYRTRALQALHKLVARLAARRVLLSYSSEGHVPLDALMRGLGQLGSVSVHELKVVGRYRPNRAARDAAAAVSEYLLVIERSTQTLRQIAFV